jgi:hypothetical protein
MEEEDLINSINEEEEQRAALQRDKMLQKLKPTPIKQLQTAMQNLNITPKSKIEEDRLLKQQQDAEFEASLAKDQEKQRQKEEQEKIEQDLKEQEEESRRRLDQLNSESPELRRLKLAEAFERKLEKSNEKEEINEEEVLDNNEEEAVDNDDEVVKEIQQRNEALEDLDLEEDEKFALKIKEIQGTSFDVDCIEDCVAIYI